MADIDLKTETPDTSLPATGFLFGADSQASASPSVYTTQSVATRLLGSTTLSGTTITANAPVVDFAQTWNNAAVTFTGAKLNITDTASNAASLLMDLQVGGATRFNIAKSGAITITGTTAWGLATGTGTGANQAFFAITGGAGQDNYWNFAVNGTASLRIRQTTAAFAGSVSGTEFVASNGNFIFASNNDLLLTRRGAANLRLGAADAAAPVAQTLSVQGVVAGTTNTAGTNFTFTGSQGTGTGAGGNIVFQVAPAGSSGSAQNALATALTINSASNATFAGLIDNRGASNYIFTGNSSVVIGTHGSGSMPGLALSNGAGIVWTSSGGAQGGSVGLALAYDAANKLALKNGANAQEFRVYETTTGTIYKAILGDRGLMKISGAAFADGAGAQAGTLTNAPAVGNPTKWISIDDNGTTRYIPAW
jgi:hypothetical protein